MERSFQFLVTDMVLGEKGSARKAFFNFFKSMFGAGILTFANAFSKVGLELGVVTFLVCYIVIGITTYMLLDCYRIATMLTGREMRSYEDVAGFVFGRRGKRIVQRTVAALQVLFCTGFLIVYADNMVKVAPSMSRGALIGAAFPALVVLSWIPSLKDMWFISVLGLLVYLLGVVVLSSYDGAAYYDEPDDIMEWKMQGLGHFFGVATYAMEGICLVVPTVLSMREPQQAPGVIFAGLTLYAAVTLTFGAFTYAAGLGSCDIITSCLESGFPTTGVRIALSAALLLTHPVYIMVPAKIIEDQFLRSLHYFVLAQVPGDGRESDGRISAPLYPPFAPSPFAKPGGAPSAATTAPSGAAGPAGGGAGGDDPLYATSQRLVWARFFEFRGSEGKSKIIRLVLVGLTCAVAASGIKFSTFSVLVGSVLTTIVGFIIPTIMWWRMYVLLEKTMPQHGTAAAADRAESLTSSTYTSPLLAGGLPAKQEDTNSSLFTVADALPPQRGPVSQVRATSLASADNNSDALYGGSNNSSNRGWLVHSYAADSAMLLGGDPGASHPTAATSSFRYGGSHTAVRNDVDGRFDKRGSGAAYNNSSSNTHTISNSTSSSGYYTARESGSTAVKIAVNTSAAGGGSNSGGGASGGGAALCWGGGGVCAALLPHFGSKVPPPPPPPSASAAVSGANYAPLYGGYNNNSNNTESGTRQRNTLGGAAAGNYSAYNDGAAMDDGADIDDDMDVDGDIDIDGYTGTEEEQSGRGAYFPPSYAYPSSSSRRRRPHSVVGVLHTPAPGAFPPLTWRGLALIAGALMAGVTAMVAGTIEGAADFHVPGS